MFMPEFFQLIDVIEKSLDQILELYQEYQEREERHFNQLQENFTPDKIEKIHTIFDEYLEQIYNNTPKISGICFPAVTGGIG